MDFSPIIGQVIGAFWYLIPIAILAGVLNSPWFKGLVGEFIVNFLATLLLDKNTYHLIKNVTLPTEDGSTQIDHIIVSEFGVFVVETKHMKGWIFGSPNQKTWTQRIYKHSNQFQNPLHQNYKHIKTLESLLRIDEQHIFSVIVFVGDSTFKTKMPENVTYGAGYVRYIKSKNMPILTASQVTDITNKIAQQRFAPSFNTHRQHVKNLVANKENNPIPSCPKCGASMVLREAKKGQNMGNKFWGCSRFPQCRGISNFM